MCYQFNPTYVPSLFENIRFKFNDSIAQVEFSFLLAMLHISDLIDQVLDWFFKIQELAVHIGWHRQ